ncbi:TetR family transcriptional regulator [Streptomyces calidiresistens]|uniref:TetR family transcriptional regulator n=1 Tax=Streptomyces calidiresistens TaxID=1485586 RepID=A0A7W3T2J7_9ACTN|nr:TetR/AcrR family transcriptional regulator [Streptomyces calidiresistens]MBB0229774.1 TetR family transcriptional regulator [Streptomyces calidiresistens]
MREEAAVTPPAASRNEETGRPDRSGETLWDTRRRRTHRDIRRAARELALERGVAAVTVDEIAAAAGVSRRTFFNYFRSKEDALLEAPPALAPDAVERFVHADDLSFGAALAELVRGHARDIIRDPDGIATSHRLVRENPELAGFLLEMFAEAERALIAVFERRLTRTGEDIDPRLAAALTGCVMRVAVECRRAEATPGDAPTDPDALVAEVDRVLEGLRAVLAP